MPARTDHERRDAQHAATATVMIYLGKYRRRLIEEAYAHIEEVTTRHDGIGSVDWTEVGKAGAYRALANYGIDVAPEGAIEGVAPALEAGADPALDT